MESADLRSDPVPIDRLVASGVRDSIGIVRRRGSAAEQIEFVTQDSRRRVNRRLDQRGVVPAQAVERGSADTDILRASREPSRRPLVRRGAGLRKLVGPSTGTDDRGNRGAARAPETRQEPAGPAKHHERRGLRALMIRFHPAVRSTSGRNSLSRRGTSSGEIWRCTISMSVKSLNNARSRALV